jgi:4-hydroxybenzoate polyprenyltransferase
VLLFVVRVRLLANAYYGLYRLRGEFSYVEDGLRVFKATAVASLLIVAAAFLYEHTIVRPHDLSRLNRAFFSVNGFIGIALFGCALLDLLVRGLTV